MFVANHLFKHLSVHLTGTAETMLYYKQSA